MANPFILGARRIVQGLCQGKLGWDEKVGPSYEQAEDSIIIHVQEQYYPEELVALREGRGVSPSSPLYKLGPSLVKGVIVLLGG